jgi:hypothetical protein
MANGLAWSRQDEDSRLIHSSTVTCGYADSKRISWFRGFNWVIGFAGGFTGWSFCLNARDVLTGD